jgi:hypothetical protein
MFHRLDVNSLVNQIVTLHFHGEKPLVVGRIGFLVFFSSNLNGEKIECVGETFFYGHNHKLILFRHTHKSNKII